ncbi:wd-40 repeat protein [Stylonychia lemnae]|uniref:Wd-40 repeat protein n=1 Tax=Stylonychia lemnae TaxID=5949 RepID=A0A078AA71_STYLE|nr:wd-40 repeat protein [Stylonychia lemnae]|eukprot:CDW78457.1 wd-40 repeat protein [Stylonychia lemnae]
MVKLDDFINESESYLIEFQFNERQQICDVNIIDEFAIIIKYGQNIILFKLDEHPFQNLTQDIKIKFQINLVSQKIYSQYLLGGTSDNLFIKDEKQSYHQIYGSIYSFEKQSLQNHFIIQDLLNSQTYLIDKMSLKTTKKFDKKYFTIQYFDLYEYLLDEEFNLYKFENIDGKIAIEKVHQLFPSSFKWIVAIASSPNKFIILYKDENFSHCLLVFDSRTYQLIDHISNIINNAYNNGCDTLFIDTVHNKIYYKDKIEMEFINCINFSTNHYQSHNIIPVVNQNHLVDNNLYKEMINNFIIYKSRKGDNLVIQDLNTGVKKEIPKDYKSECKSHLQSNEEIDTIFNNGNFNEVIQSMYVIQEQQIVDDINSEDTMIRSDYKYIFLNGNRKVDWIEFRKKSGFQFEYENQFCFMQNRFNQKLYILDVASKNRIVYFNKLTQEFQSIDMNDQVYYEQEPESAILADELGILLIQSDREIFLFDLENKQRIKDTQLGHNSLKKIMLQISFMTKPSIFIGNNYLQINFEFITNILFFNNKKLHKVIQIEQIQPPEDIEVSKSYQKEYNQKSLQIIRRQDQENQSEIYTMISNSFEEMFNEEYLIQPIFPALHFEFAQRIIVDTSTVKLFINGEQQMVGLFEIDITDQIIINYRQITSLNNEQIIKELQLNLSKFFKYVAGYGTCYNLFQNNLVVLETIVKQLSLKDKQSLPILICQKMLGGESPLDFSIKAHQQKIINLILSMIIKYQDHIVFNNLVDRNLCELIKQQIDLQEYFDSNLPTYQIIDPSFPSQHSNEKELIVGINLLNPKDVHEKYNELIGEKLTEQKENTDQLVSIEYYLINLPLTLKTNPQELMKVLRETDMPEYFENKVIQSIINFKWNKYTKSFYQTRFYIYLIFMATFIFDIFYSTYASQAPNEQTNDQAEELKNDEVFSPNIWIKISAKALCSIVLIFFLIYEVKQIIAQKRSYFDDGWNYFDISHIAAFTTFCILDFTIEDSDNLILIKVLVIYLSFMKLFFFLRIYDGFSFLVQMMAGVFKDLKYFLSFFLIMILQFGMIFLVLFKAEQIDEYNGVNKLAYFLMAFRISSGDFNVDNYHSQGDLLVIFSWIIWLLAVIILNIVFMNFIIAVISESYERVMQKLVAESYKVKANMIVEREQLFSSKELEKQENFPNFIVVRRPINNEENEAGEWQGFIKDLKYTIRTSAAKSKGEILQNLHSIETQNKKNSQQLENQDQQLSNLLSEQVVIKNDFQLFKGAIDSQSQKIDSHVNGLDVQVKGLDSKVLKIQDDIDFIKNSMISLLQKSNQ